MGDDKEAAVNAFLDAQDYRDRVQRAGVTLEIPDSYGADFKQVKGEYLVDLYTRGHELLDQKKYSEAEATFAKIAKLEPGYKDAGSLQQIAYLEPLYISGKASLEAGQYRKAYNDLDRVVQQDATYKDAAALKQECITKGQYAIAVLPFTTAGNKRQSPQAATVQAYLTSALVGLNDPFLRVVDRDNIQRILDEQRLGMTGIVDESTAVSAGKLMGAQAVIIGTIMGYEETPGAVRKSTKNGYESYSVKQVDQATGKVSYLTRYKPVKYTEFYQENKSSISVSYKLVSLETGQVLMSKVVDRSADDHAWYASYAGQASALVPQLDGRVNTNAGAKRELDRLLAAPHTVRSTADLGNDVMRSVTGEAAKFIQQELTAKLP
jgi:curli biogenesis system outer membrane secretion channel CsgG